MAIGRSGLPSTLRARRSDAFEGFSCVLDTGGEGRGSEVSLSCLLQTLVVQGQFGNRPLEASVLGFQLLQAPRLVHPETTEFVPPSVECLLRDTEAPGCLNNATSRGDDRLRISEFDDDFLCCALPVGHASTTVLAGILKSILDRLWGVRSIPDIRHLRSGDLQRYLIRAKVGILKTRAVGIKARSNSALEPAQRG